jgi:drug/metabolite transporter (DMT)-like permease
MTRRSATAIGLVAVLLWSSLAVLTAASGTMPPFELLAITFAIGGVTLWLARPGAARALRQPWPVWLLGVGGLFVYHAAYFVALRNAPPVEAGLINYLWPTLIVLFSALLPGEHLRWQHIAGCLLALVGAALVVTGGRGLSLDPAYTLGYAAALVAAVTWAIYSVLSRRMGEVSSDAVAGFCMVVAVLATICHAALEPTVLPGSIWQWAAILGLGLGPVGLAFYVWDIGVKRGDIQVLGAVSYATPLLSTGLLITGGFAAISPLLLLAALLVVAGGLLAASPLLLQRR